MHIHMEKPIFILLHVLVSLSLVEVDINGYSKDLTHILSSYAKCKINSYNSRLERSKYLFPSIFYNFHVCCYTYNTIRKYISVIFEC